VHACVCVPVGLHWRGIRRGTVGSKLSVQFKGVRASCVGLVRATVFCAICVGVLQLCCTVPGATKQAMAVLLLPPSESICSQGASPGRAFAAFSAGDYACLVCCVGSERRAHNCVNCLASLALGELKLCFLVSCFRSWCEPARYRIQGRERCGLEPACTQPLHAALWAATRAWLGPVVQCHMHCLHCRLLCCGGYG
jgi:hypothetical protein